MQHVIGFAWGWPLQADTRNRNTNDPETHFNTFERCVDKVYKSDKLGKQIVLVIKAIPLPLDPEQGNARKS